MFTLGKGNYWAIHPACLDDFARGDFRRRQARRRARKSTKNDISCAGTRSPYGYNVGYVPMTSSHIGYHPYGNQPSMYYPKPSSLGSLSPPTATNVPQTSVHSPQDNYMSPGYFSDCAGSSMLAASQRLFAEQTSSAALAMQALAKQQAAFASTLQFPSW